MADDAREPDPIDVHVGARVTIYRKLAGMSQESLGAAVGVTFQLVQKYERGTNRIGASRLFAIGKTVDVPISVFFRELDGPTEERPTPLPVATREGLDPMQAFATIPDRAVRGHILALCR